MSHRTIGDHREEMVRRITAWSIVLAASFLLVQSPAGGPDPAENALQLVLKISLSQAEDTPPPQ